MKQPVAFKWLVAVNLIPRLTPVRIGWSKDWVAVAAGENHSVGLKRNGDVYAWGDVTE